MRSKLLFAVVFAALAFFSCRHTERNTNTEQRPVLLFRLNSDHTINDVKWADLLSNIQQHPDCCDEVWFSTGVSMPSLEVHKEHLEKLKLAKLELEKLGISTSLQIQMTIGHGDATGVNESWEAKQWTGWTGSTGVECVRCNCPRQEGFLKYMGDIASLYAELQPRIVWIDDDLRYDNHIPATKGSRIGCWCDKCVSEFGAENGREWTRESLDKAMAADADLAQKWKEFSIESLVRVARVIAEQTHAVSPQIKMGYQKTFWSSDVMVVDAIIKELAEVSGQKVAYRPGGSAYYDKYHPAAQIVKSMDAARFMHLLGNPDCVDSWCPEVESYPRHYGSRTAQSVLLEGFTALGYGLDAVSVFVIDRGQEDPELQARSMFGPLAEGAEVLKAYAYANEGTQVAGYRTDVTESALFDFAITGIPVLPGVGQELGKIEENTRRSVNIYGRPTSEVQRLREELCEQMPAPVVCQSAFIGLVMPRVSAEGELRTLGVVNCRIDSQGPVRFRLESVAEDVKSVVWRELRRAPVKLKVEQIEGVKYVEIPEIGAWNAGFLDFK